MALVEGGQGSSMFLVTGGAGFIGSNVVASLNEAGASDIVVNDVLGQDDAKWRNLAKRQVADLVPPAELMKWLDGRKLDAVIHMGAISDTTATDGDLVMENNFRASLRLLDWCTTTRTPFIYASSAATYGDDAVAVLRWALDTTSANGIFNVGTGKAESFRDMIGAMFKAMGRPANIEYVETPDSIRNQYQYFTKASVENLRGAGYNAGFTPLETAVGQYVTGYLDRDDRYR